MDFDCGKPNLRQITNRIPLHPERRQGFILAGDMWDDVSTEKFLQASTGGAFDQLMAVAFAAGMGKDEMPRAGMKNAVEEFCTVLVAQVPDLAEDALLEPRWTTGVP